MRWIGTIELACLGLYLAPRTSVLGALLLTGYLGGAIAAQVRVGNRLLSHTLFPIYVALVLWEACISARRGCARSCRSGVRTDEPSARSLARRNGAHAVDSSSHCQAIQPASKLTAALSI
ncbi:MAG: DoxX family protein [Terriglobia bacterium]